MYVIVVGAGVVGSRVASVLAAEHHEVVVVDQSERALDSISLKLDVRTVQGDGISPKVLHEADVSQADMVVAATTNDEPNIITCFVAKQLGAKRTVARVHNPDYPAYFIAPTSSPTGTRRIIRPKQLGVDLVVNPEVLAAEHIVQILSSLFLMPIKGLADGLVQIAEFEVEREVITKIPLYHMDFSKPARIVAIVRGGDVIIPQESTTLELRDHIILVAARDHVDVVGKMFAQPRKPTRSVMIAGGGAIGFRVAEELERSGIQVKLIEQDLERCQKLAKTLEHTSIIQGEVTSADYLREEGASSADAFVAAADRDELNVLIGLLAKKLGTSRSLAVVNQPEYMVLADTIGVDVIVSPLLLAGNEFNRFIRESTVRSAALLSTGDIEAIEYAVEEESPVIDRQVKEVEVSDQMSIGAIVRENKVLIPQGDETILVGDRVVFAGLRSAILGIDKYFERK